MIVGVDYDTNRVALCVLPAEVGMTEVIHLATYEYRGRKIDALEAVGAIVNLMHGVDDEVRGLHRSAWWIEHAFGANRAVDFKLGRVQGAIVAAVRHVWPEAAVNEVGPPEWKKGIGLPGNAKKDAYVDVLAGVVEQRGWDGEATEHEVDAFGIALHGLNQNARQA